MPSQESNTIYRKPQSDNTDAATSSEADSFSTVDISSMIALGILLASLCYLLYSLCSLCRETWGGSTNSSGESKEYHSVRQAEVDDEEEDGFDEDSAIEMPTFAS